MNSQVNHRLRLGSSRRRSLGLVHLLPSAGRAFDIGSHTGPDFHRQATTKLRTYRAGRTNSQD
jgi:hypothetical protein